MKQSERASIMRILTDLIEADGIIDTRELEFLNGMRERYGVKKEDEALAVSFTLAHAFDVLAESSCDLRHGLIRDFFGISMSDNFCAKEEALLIWALRMCLIGNLDYEAKVISVNTADFVFDSKQILYVESEYDDAINEEIVLSHRDISNEVRLAGFDFVYIPTIAEHYKSISYCDIMQITEFLYPKVSMERLNIICNQLQNLSTSEFCKYQLGTKLNIRELENIVPSIMVRIGTSFVDDKMLSNFLVIEIGDSVLKTVRDVMEFYGENYHNMRLNYLREEKGRFIYTGFYKQIFDILMLHKGERSRVVIDSVRERIYFPEADRKIEGIHRREKALYALLLLESASGGINFSKPESVRQIEKYNKRISALQKKYEIIYHKFGGNDQKAPNILIPEIRNPMMALLRKQLSKLEEVLLHIEDYSVRRNIYGNYSVNIPVDLCCCYVDGETKNIIPLNESEEWKQIAAL